MQDLYDKLVNAVEYSDFDALVVIGADNFSYIAGASIPFLSLYPGKPVAVVWPKKGEPTVIVPEEWEGAIKNLSSLKRIKPYSFDGFVKAVANTCRGIRENGRIGIDTHRITEALLQELKGALEAFKVVSCDGFLRELRKIKTKSEIELLEDLAYKVDHGIFGTQHHVLIRSSRSEMSLGEEIRVHCLERGLDVVGGHSISLSASGEHTVKFWPLAPYYGIGREKYLQPGEFVRMEARYSIDGYWGVGCRLMTMGYPSQEQREAYNDLVALREKAVQAAKPGVRCSDVYKVLEEEARKREAKLVMGLPLGHGIGVTDVEAPYISVWDETVICEGMVFVIRPVIMGSKGELLWNSDTAIVEANGLRVVGWYKDWREPYVANYTL